jgi:hypothetical protein
MYNYFLIFCFFLHLEILVVQQYLYASFNGCLDINKKRFILQVHHCSYLCTTVHICSNVLSVLTLFQPCWYRLYLRPGGVALRPKSSINDEENTRSQSSSMSEPHTFLAVFVFVNWEIMMWVVYRHYLQ